MAKGEGEVPTSQERARGRESTMESRSEGGGEGKAGADSKGEAKSLEK